MVAIIYVFKVIMKSFSYFSLSLLVRNCLFNLCYTFQPPITSETPMILIEACKVWIFSSSKLFGRTSPVLFRCVSTSRFQKTNEWQTESLRLSSTWDSLNLYDYVQLCTTMYDYVWLCMTMYDQILLYMTMFAYVCLPMRIYDYVWQLTM